MNASVIKLYKDSEAIRMRWAALLFICSLSGSGQILRADDDTEFIQHAPKSAQEAAAVEDTLRANSDDHAAHVRLFGYYWSQATFFNRTDLRRQTLEQADWFAQHDPQSTVFERADFNLKPADFTSANITDLQRYKTSWKSAVDRYPADATVLLHALRALQNVDLDVPFSCSKRLRLLMPTYPQFAVQLAGDYIRIIDVQSKQKGGTSRSFTELQSSTDPAVVGLTGEGIYGSARLDKGAEPMTEIGVALLRRAHELDTSNQRWSNALTSAPPANLAEIASRLNTIKQRDLWVGGQVRGVIVPEGAVTVDPDIQAAKLESPSTAFIKNALGTKLGPGEVRLLAIIGPDGHVQQLQFESGSVKHLPSAMGMAKGWRYSPTLSSGKPVSVVTFIDFRFTAPFTSALPLGGVLGSMPSASSPRLK